MVLSNENFSDKSIDDDGINDEMERAINGGKSSNKKGTLSAAASVPSISALSVTEKPVDAIQLIKKGTKWQVIQGVIADYSNATSIHGIKYFGGNDKAWYVRILWLAIISISVYYCVILTLQTWNHWYYNPVIVSLAEKSTPIWEIPFPAITICPMVKYNKKFQDAYLEALDEFNDGEVSKEHYTKFNAITHLCSKNPIFLKGFKLKNNSDEIPDFTNMLQSAMMETNFTTVAMDPDDKAYYEFYDITPDSPSRGTASPESSYKSKEMRKFTLRNTIKDIAPLIEKTIKTTKWRKNILNSLENMKEILTSEGLCYSFNAFHNSDIFRHNIDNKDSTIKQNITWSLDGGYFDNIGTKAYPRRVIAGDVDESFYVKLKSRNIEEDVVCNSRSRGYKVILHIPEEYPQVNKRFFRVPFNQAISVAVKPNVISTAKEVRTYNPEARQCFFNNERYLKYFKIYTQGNCEHECLSNYTLMKCNCIYFAMPKDEETQYCNVTKMKCYKSAKKELLRSDGFKSRNCNCLPSCTSIAYDAEVTQSILNPTTFNAKNDDYEFEVDEDESENEADFRFSIMNVFFANDQFLSAKRSELYGIADLIANIGGLFGLFMGVSILSLVEILYFCTVRMYVNIKMRIKNKKKKTSEDIA